MRILDIIYFNSKFIPVDFNNYQKVDLDLL